ncbi:glycosidase [Mesotoga prima]|uniref:glycoside hydrolase family 130 protein n=1 Tax=Mesotoga prima TaxID=1184387 RepID=UPI002C243025|nr:glycosidase [Mesotoga prima]HOP37951.1 glycosidase [Mesotoga prima]
MIKLERHPLNPLFSPISQHHWESKYVFNCAVIKRQGLFHMIYRAQGEDMVSRMGYAVSLDGVRFNRFEKPVFTPGSQLELYGVEDPRLTEIEGKVYMQYTAYSPKGVRISMASTTDFLRWERHGVIIPDVDNKDAALFPAKVKGRYLMFHRIEPDMYLAYSEDLRTWTEFTPIAGPRSGKWDNLKIGVGAPPIETEYGWLVLYHGVENTPRPTYRLGFMLLDLENPEKVVKRSDEPILEPEEEWEIFGGVPNVVFSDAMVEHEEKYFVYYGAADNHIALATIDKETVVNWIRS